jgi:hypothetical protein
MAFSRSAGSSALRHGSTECPVTSLPSGQGPKTTCKIEAKCRPSRKFLSDKDCHSQLDERRAWKVMF